jgi:hypothetical protein
MGLVRERIRAIANGELFYKDRKTGQMVDKNIRIMDDYHELDKYFIRTGKNPKGADTTTSWCGLFACWVLMEAGLNVRWGINQRGDFGIINTLGNQVELVDNRIDHGKRLRAGDVGILGAGSHHCIVDIIYEKREQLITIEGNAKHRSPDCIERRHYRTRSVFDFYYRLLVD